MSFQPDIDDEPEFTRPVVGHAPSYNDRCICTGVIVYFEDGDIDGEVGEGCEVADRVFPPKCGICEERIVPPQERGEMYDPKRPLDASRIVHAECGLARGWRIA